MTDPLAQLADAGVSIWLDDLSRVRLRTGSLREMVQRRHVSGVTTNPSIFAKAISSGDAYRSQIEDVAARGAGVDEALRELTTHDVREACDVFRPVYDATDGVDGRASIEVDARLAHDTDGMIAEARSLWWGVDRPNLFIKIPGTAAGLPAIEEAIFAGVPVNVTLLFSAAQVLAAADAWLRGIERRIAAGLPAVVASVASLFVSRWDVAVAPHVPADLHLKLGIAVGHQSLAAYNAWQASPRVKRAMNFGAPPQRLLFASTGMKDPQASPTRYVEALAAPFTIDTIPEATLHALAERGRIEGAAPADGGDCEAVLAAHRAAGIDLDALAARLQTDGVAAFNASWRDLMAVLEARGAALAG